MCCFFPIFMTTANRKKHNYICGNDEIARFIDRDEMNNVSVHRWSKIEANSICVFVFWFKVAQTDYVIW